MSSNFDKFIERNKNMVGLFQAGLARITINAVDKHAKAFYNRVKEETPKSTSGLIRSIKLSRIIKKGIYGYRVSYKGYRDKDNTAWQIIANTLNKGYRTLTNGKSVSLPRHINFITNQLNELAEINPEIEQNMKLSGWAFDDIEIIVNDGTTLTSDSLKEAEKLANSEMDEEVVNA